MKNVHFDRTMQCLPQRLKINGFWNFFQAEQYRRGQQSENCFLQKMLILAFELKRVHLSCQISVFFPVLVHSAWAWNTAAKICSSILVCVESPVWKNVPSFVNDRFFAHRWRCCWFVKKIYYIIILCIVNYDFFFYSKKCSSGYIIWSLFGFFNY